MISNSVYGARVGALLQDARAFRGERFFVVFETVSQIVIVILFLFKFPASRHIVRLFFLITLLFKLWYIFVHPVEFRIVTGIFALLVTQMLQRGPLIKQKLHQPGLLYLHKFDEERVAVSINVIGVSSASYQPLGELGLEFFGQEHVHEDCHGVFILFVDAVVVEEDEHVECL